MAAAGPTKIPYFLVKSDGVRIKIILSQIFDKMHGCEKVIQEIKQLLNGRGNELIQLEDQLNGLITNENEIRVLYCLGKAISGTNIRYVGLVNNKITTRGACALLEALGQSYVFCLNLSGNLLGIGVREADGRVYGGQDLAQYIHGSKVYNLILNNNPIHPNWAMDFCARIPGSPLAKIICDELENPEVSYMLERTAKDNPKKRFKLDNFGLPGYGLSKGKKHQRDEEFQDLAPELEKYLKF